MSQGRRASSRLHHLRGHRTRARGGRRQRAVRVRVPVRRLWRGPRRTRLANRRVRIARRPWWRRPRYVASAVAVALLALGAAWLIPPLLAARTAYEEVFVPDAPRPVVTVNPRGTPEVVMMPTEAPPPLPDWDRQERINLLLIGADTNSDRLEAGEPALSDTLIIVTIDPVSRQVGLLSIPRDLLVTIPGVGQDKINAAYSIGSLSELTGPGLARATVEYNFGITIHYFAQVDFEGFQRIIDTLGGVIIDVPAPLKDDAYPGEGFSYTRIYFYTGLQHMDGKTALRYARTRHDDNDFARANRQQQILLALREQAVARNLIANARELLVALSDTVRTDIPPLDLLKLAKLGTEIQPQDIHTYSILPATSVEWNPPGPYLLIPDWEAVHEIMGQMIPPEPAVAPEPTVSVRPPAAIQPI